MNSTQTVDPVSAWLAQRAETRHVEYPGGHFSLLPDGRRVMQMQGMQENFVVAESKVELAQLCIYTHAVEQGLIGDTSESYRIARKVAEQYREFATREQRLDEMRKELADPVAGGTWLDGHLDLAQEVAMLLRPGGERHWHMAYRLVFGIVSAMY